MIIEICMTIQEGFLLRRCHFWSETRINLLSLTVARVRIERISCIYFYILPPLPLKKTICCTKKIKGVQNIGKKNHLLREIGKKKNQ